MQTLWQHLCTTYFFGSELLMFSVSLFLSFELPFVIMNAILIYLDTRVTRFDVYRIQKDRPKVFSQPNIVSAIIKGTIRYQISLILFSPVLYYLLNLRGHIDMTGPTPSWFTISWQLLLFIVSEDTLFYWGHYLFHTKFLYKYHKEHHAFTQPIGPVAVLSDPFESLLQIQIAVWLAPALLPRKHIFTLILWIIIRVHQTIYAHGGYELPYIHGKYYFPKLFMGCRPHDYHHRKGVDNYGSFFTFWDHLMGTFKEPRRFETK
jgi:4-alpha-methyl-delta7-sterol-4alpha-methyl oxidase